MQTKLDDLEIDRAVTDLSRAEKVLLIYLSLEDQISESQGDLAKTINSTANQQKIFSEQTQRLSRVLGNVFSPALTKVLYVANGLLMVIVELIEAFAEFIGFEIPTYDVSTGGYEDLSDYLDEVEDSATGASNALKGLRSFDKLNNITTPTSSSSGSGTSGVDQRLLDALTEYDLGLDNINNKATQIRDKIMSWLGFTKEINAETGEITWKYDTLGKSAEQIAKEVGTNLGKALTEETNNIDWENIGSTIAKGLNIAMTFAVSFIENYSWVGLGSNIATGLNNAIDDLNWTDVGKLLTTKLKIMIDTAYGFVTTLDWDKLGEGIGDAINGAIENINLDKVADTLNKVLTGTLQACFDALMKIKWGDVFTKLTSGLSKLNPLLKVFIGFKVYETIKKISNQVNKSKLVTFVSKLCTPVKNLVEYIRVYTDLAKKEGVTGLEKYTESIKLGTTAWQNNLTAMDKVKAGLIGAGGILEAINLFRNGFDGLKDGVVNFQDVFNIVTGVVVTGFSTMCIAVTVFKATLDAATLGITAVISVIVAAIAYLASSTTDEMSEVEQAIEDTRTAMENFKDEVEKSTEKTDFQAAKAEALVKQLKLYVDENGKVVGSTHLVNEKLTEINTLLGTEYKLTGDTITQNGNKITSYQNLKKEIDTYCENLRTQAYEEAALKLYNQALESKIDLQKKLNSKQQEMIDLLEDNGGSYENLSKKEKKHFDQLAEDYLGLAGQIAGYEKDMDNYATAATYATEGDIKNAEEYMTKSSNIVFTNLDEMQRNTSGTLKESITELLKSYYGVKEKWEKPYLVSVDRNALDKLIADLKEKNSFSIKVNADTTGANTSLNEFINQNRTITIHSKYKNSTGFATGGLVKNGYWQPAGYADGGLPEDGWFRASKGEYFGHFDDGTSYIANNKQITDGIRQSTMNGMMDALQYANQQKQNVNVTIVAEDDGLLNSIKFKEKDRDRQYGY